MPEPYKRLLYKNIPYLRGKKGISQQTLADHIDVSPSCIGAYEENISEPKLKTLILIADYFELSLDEIVKKDLAAECQEK